MNIDLTPLASGYKDSIVIDATCVFDEEQLKGSSLLSLHDVKVTGKIYAEYDEYHINVSICGRMVIPCSITLEPVDYPFHIQIDENLEEWLNEFEKKYKKYQNSIDILPIIWENILMEIPMKVVSEKAKDIHLEGDGWRLMADGEDVKNSPFEKLNDLIK